MSTSRPTGNGGTLPTCGVALVVIGSLAACEPYTYRGTPLITDSAGVTVVDHGAVVYEQLPQLSLATSPVVSIGVVDGPAEFQFDDVTDALRRRDGSILVVDRSRTLRAFDSTGAYLWSAGSDGDGPGEFRFPQRITEVAGDTIVVWDPVLGRLSLFVDPGRFVRAQTVDGLAGIARVLGASANNRFLVERRSIERAIIDAHSAIISSADILHMDMTGSTVSLGRESLGIQYQEVDEGGAYSPAIFGTPAVLAPALDGYWYGDATRYELKQVSARGELTTIVRWIGPDQSIRDADFEEVLEVWTGGPDADPDIRQFMREYGRSHPRAARFPSYEQLLADPSGELWVRDFVRDHDDDGRRRWLLFSPDGTEILGRLEHDARFRPLRTNAGWVLGVERDDLDVERVVLVEVSR